MQNPRQDRTIQRSNCSISWLLCILLGFAFSSLVRGQAVSTLHTFGTAVGDGGVPLGGLIQGLDGNFYGTTNDGGSTATGSNSGLGTVFKMTPQGVVSILHNFGDQSVTNDGEGPTAGLVQGSDGNFYGTTSAGGSAGEGTIFMITPSGGVTILHNFGDPSVPNDGVTPLAGLIQGSDGNFYGTTRAGGSAGLGCVFEITSQKQISIIHSFGGSAVGDGASPAVGLVQDSQGNLYGTTPLGGSSNQGVAYKIDSQKQESIFYNFGGQTSFSFTLGLVSQVNGAGAYSPNSRLVLDVDGNLYGTTAGGFYGNGAIYEITPQGQAIILHYFDDGTVSTDGQEMPRSDTNFVTQGEKLLIRTPDGTLYGTTVNGGSAGRGTIFKMTAQGQVTILHSFGDGTVSNDGIEPLAGMIQGSDGKFYGTTSGANGATFCMVPEVPAIVSPQAITSAVGQPVTYQAIATQVPTSFSATGLPAGLSINNSTGLISGTPPDAGTSNVTLTATNAAGSNSINLVIVIVTPPVVTSMLSEFASTTAPISCQITASENPTSFGAIGLPAGLSINTATGVISGTPNVNGTFSITISATNVAGTGSSTLTLVVTNSAPTYSQEYVNLFSFDSSNNGGIYPGAIIPGGDGSLYGVTAQGGVSGSGTIFNLTPAGNESVVGALGGANGASPKDLVQGSDGNFYGATQNGGSANLGTVFKVTPAGVVTLLHAFLGNISGDGANPQGGVILGVDGNFYGITQFGGTANKGTIFKITPSGAVTIIHSFGDNTVTNDGSQPVAELVLDTSSGTGIFYGTTLRGGSADDGTVFSMGADGTVTTLHSFGDNTVANDGQMPHATLTPMGNFTLVGTTFIGGTFGKGTIFQIAGAGTSNVVTILHNFGDGSVTNDGINPMTYLLVTNNAANGGGAMFFGATQNGGANGQGTVFSFDASNNLTIVHSFGDSSMPNDGETPMSGLCLGADGNLYGTTMAGGGGYGTAYAIVANFPDTNGSHTKFPAPYWILTGTLPPGMAFDGSTGTITGTPLSSDPIGAYAVSITLVIDNHPGSPEPFTINLAPQSTQDFYGWSSSHNFTGLPTDTPRKDGVPNLLKYLFDIEPTTPMTASDRAALPTLGHDTTSTPGTDYLTLTFRENPAMTDITVNLQISSDMVNWQSVTPDIDKTNAVGSDDVREMGVKMTGSGPQFLRLNVTMP